MTVSRFTGVDSSAAALGFAAEGLRAALSSDCTLALEQEEMYGFMERCGDGEYDLIISTFAIHHFRRVGHCKVEVEGASSVVMARHPAGQIAHTK